MTPIADARATASTAAGRLDRHGGGTGPSSARASFGVDPDDPVFPGHYPGYPVLPGVYLIEFADRAVRALLDGTRLGDVRLAAVERCRFLAPVHRGEEVVLDIDTEDTGDGVRCAVGAATGRGRAADIVLRYRAAPDPAEALA